MKAKGIFKATAVLVIICFIIAAALASTNMLTEDAIAARAAEEQTSAMRRIVQADKYNRKTLDYGGETAEYYIAESDGEIKGYIFITEENGYGGADSVMTGINTEGKIMSVEILDVSNETVGLGQNAAKPEFKDQFSGKSGRLEVTKSGEKGKIETITGATITSQAIIGAVNEAFEQYKLAKEEN